jgi:integrase
MTGKLSNARVKSLNQTGRYGDGGGLWLQVSKWQTKSWILRYWVDGKERCHGLGAYPLIGLADARELALKARRDLRINGVDPIDSRKSARIARRLEQAKALTFGQCAESYIEAHAPSWKDQKHLAQWRRLEKQAKAIWTLPVQAIDTDAVLRVLEPLWKTRTVTANRVRGRLELVIGYATGRGLRSGENPARWKGHLQTMLAAPTKLASVKHHAAIAFDAIPAFMADLRAKEGITARALEIVALTCLRTGEALDATWDEIDLAGKVWTIPAERMKAGKEHKVPLSGRAVAILSSLPRLKDETRVFVGARKGHNEGSLLKLLRDLNPDVTVHGLRSSFRDWAGEKTNFPPMVAEMALAHAISSAVEKAYRRGDLFEKRRKLMDSWAAYCATSPKTGADNVVNLRA